VILSQTEIWGQAGDYTDNMDAAELGYLLMTSEKYVA
jgi:hypothetical protein